MAILAWEGCFNVRDVGGLPTEDGGALRPGVQIRSDAQVTLTPAGWKAARGAGVVRVVDLRYLSTEPVAPPPELGLRVERVELYPDNTAYWERARGDLFEGEASLGEYLVWQYLNALETRGPQLVEAVEAIASAPAPGAAVVHCQAGKDRTGMVVGLVLSMAGTTVEAIKEDYALSGSAGRRALRRWVEEARDPEERKRRGRLSDAPAEAIEGMLAELERRWGGAEEYLLANGASIDLLARLRARLREGDAAG